MGTVALRAELDISGVELPQPCLSVPSMISINERKLLYHLVKDHYTGAGFIIDAGIFLGSSTLAFGMALLNRSDKEALLRPYRHRATKPIHGYDKCIATPHMVRFLQEDKHPLEGSLHIGDDFSPLLADQVGKVASLVDLHIGDLKEYGWDASDGIEVLFIDVAKSLSLHKHILRQFMPALIVDSYIIQQDFFFAELPWIKVTMAHLRDHFELLGEAHASAVFRCTNADWGDKLARDPWDKADLEELLHLHDSWLDATSDRRRRAMMELSSVHLMVAKESFTQADERLRRIEEIYADIIAIDTGYASLEEKVQNAWALVRNEPTKADDSRSLVWNELLNGNRPMT